MRSGQWIIVTLTGDRGGVDLPSDFYDTLCDDIEAAMPGLTAIAVDPKELTTVEELRRLIRPGK